MNTATENLPETDEDIDTSDQMSREAFAAALAAGMHPRWWRGQGSIENFSRSSTLTEAFEELSGRLISFGGILWNIDDIEDVTAIGKALTEFGRESELLINHWRGAQKFIDPVAASTPVVEVDVSALDLLPPNAAKAQTNTEALDSAIADDTEDMRAIRAILNEVPAESLGKIRNFLDAFYGERAEHLKSDEEVPGDGETELATSPAVASYKPNWVQRRADKAISILGVVDSLSLLTGRLYAVGDLICATDQSNLEDGTLTALGFMIQDFANQLEGFKEEVYEQLVKRQNAA